MNTSMTYGVKEEQTYDYRNIGKKHLLCFTRPLSLGEGARLLCRDLDSV